MFGIVDSVEFILSEFMMSWIMLFFGDVSRDAFLIIRQVLTERKTGILARREIVDQAREGLCNQRETLRFNMLNIEKIACSDLS